MIDICMLGTCGMMPLPGRWLSSVLLRCGSTLTLFDCGEGTQIPWKSLGWGFRQLGAICFSHMHADHVAGLPGVLFMVGLGKDILLRDCDVSQPSYLFPYTSMK